MKAAVIIPCRGEPQLLQWTVEGYARQTLAPGNSLEIRVGIDGDPAPQLAPSPNLTCTAFPRMGAGAVRNALVNATSADTDLIIFGNADARPEPDMVQRHMDAFHSGGGGAGPPSGAMVLGDAPWEPSASPLVWQALLAETPTIFFYSQLAAGQWYDFRHAWTLNLSVRRADFLAARGFFEHIRPVYYEDLALGFRLLGKDRKGILYEPRARVIHRHPTSVEQYLDREELLGIMAPVLARNCPAAFGILFGTRDLEALARSYRAWIDMDAAMHKWIYQRLTDFAAQPADTLGTGPARSRTLLALYQMHIPLKRLAFRLGFLKGLKLAEDSHWQERRSEGLWRKIVL